jgi:hypothetical protein
VNDGLRPSERSHEQPAKIIPQPARQEVERYRFTDLSADGGLVLAEGSLSLPKEAIEVDRRQFGQVQIRPERVLSLTNYYYCFATPSLHHSICLFGKQGLLTPLLLGADIYGPLGIIIASVFFTFPHALIILLVARLSSSS